MPVVSLEQLLDGDPGKHLGKIVHIARKMDKLTEALRAALPPELAEHLVAAAIRGERELGPGRNDLSLGGAAALREPRDLW